MVGDCHVAGKTKRDMNIESVCVANVCLWPIPAAQVINCREAAADPKRPFSFLPLADIDLAVVGFMPHASYS